MVARIWARSGTTIECRTRYHGGASSSTNRSMYKSGRLLSIKKLKFLEASTSIEIGNNGKTDNSVKKNKINNHADKSNSE